MRPLIFSCLLVIGCASDYKGMSKIAVDQDCLKKIRAFQLPTDWYDTSIDVVGKHVSGLLLFKQMPDKSHRVVFTNEAGVKFFDFEFDGDEFTVHHVIPQLNRNVIINLLRRDFEMILDAEPDGETFSWKRADSVYFGIRDGGKILYYIASPNCDDLSRIESGSKRKRVSSLVRYGDKNARPDSLILNHHTFDMKLVLRKLEK